MLGSNSYKKANAESVTHSLAIAKKMTAAVVLTDTPYGAFWALGEIHWMVKRLRSRPKLRIQRMPDNHVVAGNPWAANLREHPRVMPKVVTCLTKSLAEDKRTGAPVKTHPYLMLVIAGPTACKPA